MTASINWHHLAWWCLPLLVLASVWHLRATLRGHPLPGRWARVGLALIITTGVLLSYRTLNGLTAGATLLAAMTAAKLFEARAARDWYVIIAATLFLLLAACLDRQQLWRLPTYALCLWLDAAALRGLSGGAVPPATTLLRESGRQLLYALPLAILLFLFFPRLPGAFWTLPDADTAVTGLGEEMSPADIARLVESDEPALQGALRWRAAAARAALLARPGAARFRRTHLAPSPHAGTHDSRRLSRSRVPVHRDARAQFARRRDCARARPAPRGDCGQLHG